MKKLVLFIHGLGGSEETWGEFPSLIWDDEEIDKDEFWFASYEYGTSWNDTKATLSIIGKVGSFFKIPYVSTVTTGVSATLRGLLDIEDVARILHSEIDIRYKAFEDIYIVAHDMGGLVAQRYIVDILAKNRPLKVKKLMLYDVPNHGTSLAKISLLYPHSQVKQLTSDSPFMEEFNRNIEFQTLDQKIDVQYIVCVKDSIVDIASATAGYKQNALELERTHTEIVKPKSHQDLVYISFKNFIQTTDDEFISTVINRLISKQLAVLFYQNHTDIASTQRALRKKATKSKLGDTIYDFVVPNTKDIQEYCKALAAVFDREFADFNAFTDYIRDMLANNEKIFLYVTGFENGDLEINREFAQSLRTLKEYDEKKFYSLVLGREKLYAMVSDTDNQLSPLNDAEEFYFPNIANLKKRHIRASLEKLSKKKSKICDYSNGLALGTLDSDEPIKTLFWDNILSVDDNGSDLRWRDDETKARVREIFSCR